MQKIIGSKIYYFSSLPSTQDKAKEIARYEDEGCTIVSDIQTEGRGRKGRKWISEEGGIYVSLVLKPDIPVEKVILITLLSAVSVSETIEKIANIKISLKWPNDILINNRKVCGILCESVISDGILHFVIVGIGVNLNNKIKHISHSLLYPATSIFEETGKIISKKKFIHTMLSDLNRNYIYFKKYGPEKILKRWKEKSSTLNKNVTVLDGDKKIKGKAIDITNDGYLVLETGQKRIKIITGDLTH